MRRILRTLSLLSSLLALAATVWIVVPAPARFVWLFSVLASEWSLAFGAFGLVGCLSNLIARALGGTRLWLVPAGAGALAALLALYPLASGWRAAHAQGVSLSLRQYVAGVTRARGDDANAVVNMTTYTFANIAGQQLQLDAYLPPAATADNGAGVVVVHGGAWNAGARSDFPQWNYWLARQGFAVFDVDYRLAPQPNWQTATGDVKCAVLWIKQHAAEFHLAPDRLALLGRSAGGHLALLAAYTADDAQLPPSCMQPEGDSNAGAPPSAYRADVRAVVSFYGPTDLIWAYDNPANQRVIDGPATISRFVGGAPRATDELRARYQHASPDAHVNAHMPPTLLIHGGQDQLVRLENMDLLGAQLDAAGVPNRRVLVGYAQHGFDYNFNGWGAQTVRPVLLDFLRAHTQPR